jgi:hypothetical protein
MGKPSKTTPRKPATKSAPRKRAAKPKEPTPLEAMEARIMELINEVYNTAKSANIGADNALEAIQEIQNTLSKVESSVAVIRSGASFMQQLERDAPVGLQPGDYCDASEEVADELEARLRSLTAAVQVAADALVSTGKELYSAIDHMVDQGATDEDTDGYKDAQAAMQQARTPLSPLSKEGITPKGA